MAVNPTIQRKLALERIQQFNQRTWNKYNVLNMKPKITYDDIMTAYQDGYQDGAITRGRDVVQAIYAAIVRTLLEARNDHNDAFSFLKDVDDRFMVSFSGAEDCGEVLNEFGFSIQFSDGTQRVREVE